MNVLKATEFLQTPDCIRARRIVTKLLQMSFFVIQKSWSEWWNCWFIWKKQFSINFLTVTAGICSWPVFSLNKTFFFSTGDSMSWKKVIAGFNSANLATLCLELLNQADQFLLKKNRLSEKTIRSNNCPWNGYQLSEKVNQGEHIPAQSCMFSENTLQVVRFCSSSPIEY